LNIISLFSGVGGMDLGFRKAGFNIKWANDFNNKLEKTYTFNHPDTYFDNRSIEEIKIEEIPYEGNGILGIIGSPPAQAFSASGNITQKIEAIYELIRVIEGKKPEFFVIEMVSGVMKNKFEAFFQSLEKLEYNIVHETLNAKDYGVPQNRKRVYIIGYRNDLQISFDFMKLKKSRIMTLKEAIGDLYHLNEKIDYIDNNEYIKFRSTSRTLPRNLKTEWDKPSLPIVGDTRSIPLHPESGPLIKDDRNRWIMKEFPETLYRRLTIRECARIQSFPDEFRFFYRSLTDGYRMVGNASPVKLVQLIANIIKIDLSEIMNKKSQKNKNDEMNHLKNIYDIVLNSRKKYGELKKCELHLHTPASYDYRFISGKEYKKLKVEDILIVSEKNKYLSSEAVNDIRGNMEFYLKEDYKDILRKQDKPFDSFKEYLAYMNIAHKLYSEGIEVVVISDHNTIKGYNKLKHAIEEYYKSIIKKDRQKTQKQIDLFLGVEISCSDKNHLVTIFESKQFDILQKYLEDIILSEEDGTYIDSRKIIEDVSKLGGIAYLAHINTSDLLGNNAYKNRLFNTKNLKGIGINDVSKKGNQIERLKKYNKNIEFQKAFLTEGDSHELDTIGIKNTWIKFDKVNYTSLKKAFANFSVCIYEQKPNISRKFIKGLVVYSGYNGFLMSKSQNKEEYFNVDFSRDLNCIIGGRGTGKSTLLNIIQTIFSFNVIDDRVLDFVSNNERIYAVFHIDGSDYILKFIPQTGNEDDYYMGKKYLENSIQIKNGNKFISQEWIEVYRVEKDNFIKENYSGAKYILEDIFRRSYNINKIVSKIENEEIGDFIREVVTYGIDYADLKEYVLNMENISNNRFEKYLRENLLEIIIKLKNRKHNIENVINAFNLNNKNLIEIVYSPKKDYYGYYLDNLLDNIKNKGYIQKTYLTWNDIQLFIYDVVKKIGLLEFLNLLLNKKYKEIESYCKIKDYYDYSKFKFVHTESNLDEITDENINLIYNNILNQIVTNKEILTRCAS
jgi:DNA-cytosine methyltransferase